MIGNKNKTENNMDWLQNKTTQFIALMGIIGTLAGFGYTGATYVNRLENLEAQIGGIGDTENAQKIIEERFASIETSVEYINKSIDEGINPSLKTITQAINELEKSMVAVQTDIINLEKDNKNPLSN